MRQVDIIGIGMTRFGKHEEKSLVQLGAIAALEAIKDADIKPSEVQAGYFANGMGNRLTGDVTTGQNVFWRVGINRIPIWNVENACTSGSTAFNLAWAGIASGLYDVAMVVGAEKLMVPGLGLLNSGETELDTREGLVVAATFAMRAARHMAVYGTTREQLALVTVKNHRHGALNPLAPFGKPITVDEVINSPMVADPLTRFMFCPNADGAAAVVLCASDLSACYSSRPVHVSASVYVTGDYSNPRELVPWETDRRCCRMAYERAGLGPEDIDVVECHDANGIAEIIHYESLGLCPVGEGGRLIDSGATSLGGRIPVNPSGGLLARGHPFGATAVAQLVEGVLQLRGQAGVRQVEGAKAFIAECMGADKDADAKTCTAHILQA